MIELSGKNIIGLQYSSQGESKFQAYNPAKLESLEEIFYEATDSEVDSALQIANKAFAEYKNYSGAAKAAFLEAIANEILAVENQLTLRANQETGLPTSRITSEIGRTVGQLRSFASLVREGSWVEAVIDTGDSTRQPLPKPDLRKMLFPIGPVIVFAASNFPLAFSVAGGDTASALAAGNPVVVKAHSSHPGTSELVGKAIQKAVEKTKMPEGVFSMLHGHSYRPGQQLVMHPLTKAVGFTGSFSGGKALADLANSRKETIPFFAEMGSVNPVFVFPEAIKNRSDAIAQQLAASITLGVGQFCTKPGLIVVKNNDSLNKFLENIVTSFSKIEAGTMLNKEIADAFTQKTKRLYSEGVELISLQTTENQLEGAPVLAKTQAEHFFKNNNLHNEIFGPYALIVICENDSELKTVINNLEGQLTTSLIADTEEIAHYADLIQQLKEKAGRLIFNGMPTGVEVCHAMQHGGPFPASTDGRFSSVGTSAIKRFVRPIAFQNWPEELLPDELKLSNPLKIFRLQDNEWTRDAKL